jgi:hypothetical protein
LVVEHVLHKRKLDAQKQDTHIRLNSPRRVLDDHVIDLHFAKTLLHHDSERRSGGDSFLRSKINKERLGLGELSELPAVNLAAKRLTTVAHKPPHSAAAIEIARFSAIRAFAIFSAMPLKLPGWPLLPRRDRDPEMELKQFHHLKLGAGLAADPGVHGALRAPAFFSDLIHCGFRCYKLFELRDCVYHAPHSARTA